MRNIIEFHENYIIKKFNVTNIKDKNLIKDNFFRELAAYKKLAALNVDFTPRLLKYDRELLTLVIQKVEGFDLVELFNQNERTINSATINTIIDHLILIDAFLYNNKLNVLQISPKDLIYDPNQNKIFLIDLEYTILNSSYKQILCDRMFHSRMLEIENVKIRNLFLDTLQRRKNEFKLYYFRKIRNMVIKGIRSILPLPSKKKYLNTKIKLSY